ncbi:MAG: glycosyltransferase family 2 protein [Lachnospiraceae bacterium]|nr:glycosyltransferase family 2 protein [Lachnospiraceae bacterium]
MEQFIKNRVSVVTPVYNGEKHLSRMLESVLKQIWNDIEMILVDDGSTDATLEVAAKFQEKFKERGFTYRIVRGVHKNASAAINLGLPYVTGEYLIWPDSDDVLLPESVRIRVEFLQQHKKYNAVRSLSLYVDEETGKQAVRDEKVGSTENEWLFFDILESKTFVCCGCYMLKSERFFQIYPKRQIPEYDVGQNFQMLLPFCYQEACPTISQELYVVYQRAGSHSRRQLTCEQEEDKYKAYEALIDEISAICRITEKADKKRMEYWKDNRRLSLAKKYHKRAPFLSSMKKLRNEHQVSLVYCIKHLLSFFVLYWCRIAYRKLKGTYQ